MAKLTNKIKHRRESRSRNGNIGKRFYTALDMAIIKHDDAIENSREKRSKELKEIAKVQQELFG